MVRVVESMEQELKIAQLKKLLTTEHYETLEELEDAVDALLWAEEHDEEPQSAPRRRSLTPAR